jgi:uncharacterized protein with HEPN domain
MSPDRNDLAHFFDMLNAARVVVSFVSGRSFEDYAVDLMLRSAVERQVEIIGEAARRVSKVSREQHSEVPWRAILAQRHILAHEYGEIASGGSRRFISPS